LRHRPFSNIFKNNQKSFKSLPITGRVQKNELAQSIQNT